MCACVQPKNYLDFITNYKRILSTQRKEILETTTRLSNGLAKLTQVSAEVDVLQQELSQAKVVVEAATRECNELLEVRLLPVAAFSAQLQLRVWQELLMMAAVEATRCLGARADAILCAAVLRLSR